MGIKKRYRGVPTQDLASYDAYDLATGIGYNVFYGIDLITGNDSYFDTFTTRTDIYGDSGFKSYGTSTDIDADFDIEFNIPRTIEGDATFHIVLTSSHDMSANAMTVNVNFKHVNALGTETQIGTQVSNPMAPNNGEAFFDGLYTIPNTRFKKGEKFRMSVTAESVGTTVRLMHDPKNRLTLSQGATSTSSQMILVLPILI